MNPRDNGIQIPAYFKDSIHRFFGPEGDAWIANLDTTLHACIDKWQLTKLQIVDNLSVNLICLAESPEYGPVVLKMGAPNPEFATEITALSLYQGRGICMCYDVKYDLNAMLLERVIPGYNLKTLASRGDPRGCPGQGLAKQGQPQGLPLLDIAIDIIANLPIPVQGTPPLPAFGDWIDRAFARARREGKVGPQMLAFVDEAERLFHEITALEPARVLLHGDLHHENILYSATDGWKVIDPKGVIGVPCLECGRFIQNHLGIVSPEAWTPALDAMVTAFSSAFERPNRTTAICAFIDCVLSRVWTLEEYLSPDVFAEAEAEALVSCGFYLDFVNKLTD